MASHDETIAALLREREGYVQYGKSDRVEAVDAELERLGYKQPEAPRSRATRESRQHKS